MTPNWRQTLTDYIRTQALPVDKFSHQPRLYALACRLAGEQPFDDDVLFAACWLHDLGVFIGHRPTDPAALGQWDNVAYILGRAPALLAQWAFPAEKIPAVVAAIAQHHAKARPADLTARLLHDADVLELLGATGLLRTISKVGRDTRYPRFGDVLPVLELALALEADLLLESSRALARPRLALLRQFLAAAQEESQGIDW